MPNESLSHYRYEFYKNPTKFKIPEFDLIDLGYDTSDRLSTVVYKLNSVTVATLTITYIVAGDGAGEIDTVTLS